MVSDSYLRDIMIWLLSLFSGDSRPYLGPRSEAYKNAEEMEGQGFPKGVTEAFLKTADETNSVIMSRAPGKATTGLIDERYDLKGFHVKAKSCNWGPMAGFLCELPAFNKKGAEGIDFNVKKIEEYCEWLHRNVHDPHPFVPIKISDERKNKVLVGIDTVTVEVSESTIIGIAYEEKEGEAKLPVVTVVAGFLMEKEDGGLWALYYSDIRIKPADKQGYEDFFGSEVSKGYCDFRKSPAYQAYVKDFKDLQKEVKEVDVSNLKKKLKVPELELSFKSPFRPILGIQNPFPPYTGKTTYKNAVSGDYDLFAVWPVIPPAGYETLIRTSEIEAKAWAQPQPKQPPRPIKLFIPAGGKDYTLELTCSRNVYIEFIPGSGEMGGLQHPDYGNINEAVCLAAQTLNSLVGSIYQGREAPNVAFHGDEGGRPDIDTIDYPVAVFLPSVIFDKINEISAAPSNRQRTLVIEKHEDFLALIQLLKGQCYILLNFGWLIDLFKAEQLPDLSKTCLKKLILGAYSEKVNDPAFNSVKTDFNKFAEDKQLNADAKIANISELTLKLEQKQ